MKNKKVEIKKMVLCFLVLFVFFLVGCGGSKNPISENALSYNNNPLNQQINLTPKFKTPQEAMKWLARFYKQIDIDIDSFYGQLNSIYESGVALGHIFILARLSYVTGIDPTDLLKVKEGDYGWNAVMEAFQIKGLGGYANVGDFLKNSCKEIKCEASGSGK